MSPVEEFPVEHWNTIVALLLTSPFLLAKYSWPALKDSGAGRFIAIASVHGLVASPYKAAYISAKHGVVGLVKTLALEGAGDGITATAVCPGYVRTPLVEKQIADQARAHGLPEDDVHRAGDPRAARGQGADRAVRGRRRGGVPAQPRGQDVHRRAGDPRSGLDRALTRRNQLDVRRPLRGAAAAALPA